MSIFDHEVAKYEVTFWEGNTKKVRKYFYTIDDTIEYAKSIKEKKPIIYETRRLIVDL